MLEHARCGMQFVVHLAELTEIDILGRAHSCLYPVQEPLGLTLLDGVSRISSGTVCAAAFFCVSWHPDHFARGGATSPSHTDRGWYVI